MKIVKPSIELLWVTPNAEKVIERSGRVAYQSFEHMTDDSYKRFIRMVLERGHSSVLEHASASLSFVCDRGVSHEIVRHRLASYTQSSTRYCNYAKEQFGQEITVIKPPGLDTFQLGGWDMAMRQSEDAYIGLVRNGVSPQIARSVLPNSLKTEIAMTANFREWRHFFKLRCAPKAHPQMQEVAKMAERILVEVAPIVFGKDDE